MTTHLLLSLAVAITALMNAASIHAQAKDKQTATNGAGTFATSAKLQPLVNEAAQAALARFAEKGFQEKNLAVTLIDLRDTQRPVQASFRGAEPIYPASVIKLFYLAAAHRWIEDGRLQETEELRRAMRDMIVDSSNDATHYIVDALTGTANGAELSVAEMKVWAEKRNAVNRYFQSLGYARINVNQKPWCEGPYGRDKIFLGEKFQNRNMLTTDATARLMTEIVLGHAVNAARSAKMLELMKRDYAGTSDDADDQAHGFTGIALTTSGARLWSKAGWTSTTRHDAAYLELPSGARFVLVTFTTDQSKERDIIPTVARVILEGMKQ